ncbi:MAG: hypothetical protein HZC38_10050 [Chloroflexi bacterium]|nr:hypothetical protein [Chloroflexota bacterium]
MLFIGQDKMSEIERKRNFNQFMQFSEENALVGSPAIEAGVDFEARNLVIEESHRDSFVQRFGRAARSGRDAFVLAYSDTLHRMAEAGELETEYSRADFLDVLKENTQPRESRKIFAGIASYAYYSFWKGDAGFPFDKEHRDLCERLKRKGVPDNLLGFRSLTPYTHYQTGESISFKSLFRKRLSIESKTREVLGRPDPRIYYKSPKRNPVPAYLKDNDVAEKESLGESLIILAPITFELVMGHLWKYWVLLELAKADDLDNQSDNILLEIDGIPFTSSDGRRGVSVRFYDLDV